MSRTDLPPAEAPLTPEAFLSRWPTSAVSSELIRGVLYFEGSFDERDVAIAERTYPGRRALVNSEGALEVHPSGRGLPRSLIAT